jgi:nitrite reductase/ring-hydroxylating ferredoxin subunit
MSCDPANRREFLRRGTCGLLTFAALGLGPESRPLPVWMVVSEGAETERRFPLPAADGVNIDRRTQVIVVRLANKVYAMALACPHEHAAVKWIAKDHRFQCTKHDSRYTPEGAFTSGHTTRNLDRFPVRREGDSLVVATDRVYRSDQDHAAWSNACVEMTS